MSEVDETDGAHIWERCVTCGARFIQWTGRPVRFRCRTCYEKDLDAAVPAPKETTQ